MTHPLNLNGKRPTSINLIDRHSNLDHHKLPLDLLLSNHAIKKPRTLLYHNQSQPNPQPQPPQSPLLPLNTSTSNSTAATNTTNSTTTTHINNTLTTSNIHNTTYHPPPRNCSSITAINTNSNTVSTFINPITAHSNVKKANPDLSISQLSAIRKTLSGLVFPHPNQSNTPLDLLNPKTNSNPSPLKKPGQYQRPQHHQSNRENHLNVTPKCNLENQNPAHLDTLHDSRFISREKHRPKDKDELKREMLQWQEKYRVAIKSFVFYLDRLDQNTTLDLTAKIRTWGARVDPFFSKEVTHIITNQPVPSGLQDQSPSPRKRSSAFPLPSPTRNKENGQPVVGPCRTSRRLSGCSPDKEVPNDAVLSSHLLIRKSLELKIKIWKSEKLLNVLYRLGDQRSPIKQPPIKPSLPSLLLKEAQQGHTNEYDPLATRSDFYYFGPKAMFIMVEDANQEYKPIIVKEYTRPKTHEATTWPVMWGGAEGKSAFSRHSAKASYLQVRNRIRQMFEMLAKDTSRDGSAQPKVVKPLVRTGSCDKKSMTPHRPDRVMLPQQNLRRAVSMNILQRRQSARLSRNSIYSKSGEPAEHRSDNEVSQEIDHVNTTTPQYHRGPGKVFLAASGNSVSMTSNMASATSTRSTALLPAAQMGRHLVDKRLAALGKRPTFEIHNQGDSSIGQAGSTKDHDVGTTELSRNRLQTLRKDINHNNSTSTSGNLKRSQSLDSSLIAKKKAQDSQLIQKSKRKGLGVRAKLGNGFDLLDLKRLARADESKAGYCENCRMKYGDFKKHVLCRKHRKFALDEDNWVELDYMLKRTTRKLKPGVSVPPSVREMILFTQQNEDGESEEGEEGEGSEEDSQGEEESEVEEDEEEEEEEEEEEHEENFEHGEEEEEEPEEEEEKTCEKRREVPQLKILNTVDSDLTHSCINL